MSPSVKAFRLALLLFAVLAAPAHAFFNKVDPGELPELDADEGLLVVAVDTATELSSVRVHYEGGLLTKAKLSDIPKGGSMALFKMKAGHYQWTEIITANHRSKFDLTKKKELDFQVEAGKINFPGELMLHQRGHWMDFHVANHGLHVLDWLRAQHPGVMAQFPFRYSGHYPDPFPDFLAKEVGTRPVVDQPTDVTPWPAAAGKFGELARPSQVQGYSLSPHGDLLLSVGWDGKQYVIDATDLVRGEAVRLFDSPRRIIDVQWKGDRDVLVGIDHATLAGAIYAVIHVDADKPVKERFAVKWITRPGFLLSVLPDDPTHVLFESAGNRRNVVVNLFDISSPNALAWSMRTKDAERLNVGVEDDLLWFADLKGQLALALVQRDDHYALARRVDGTFKDVFSFTEERHLHLIGLSGDLRYLYCLTDDERDQTELVELDLDNPGSLRTVFAKPGVDIVSAVFDDAGRPVAASYYDQGGLVSQYFDAAAETLMKRLSSSLGGRNVEVAARSLDGARAIVAAESPERGATYYVFDQAKQELSELDEARPWLKDQPASSRRTFSANSSDGLAIESYLSLPPGEGKVPLVLFPHGGPIEVRDSVDFDPEVQFLLGQGFGVLQVNFRGSKGYGKAFRAAGKGSLGTLIEDDLDAALTVALQDSRIDGHRLCVLGGSYGGFSALISTIRWPQRFRCAVAMYGVSDWTLLFTASDNGRVRADRTWWENAVGNPNASLEALEAISPLYRYRDLTTPLLLVHGDNDQRVDYENSARLVRMLSAIGRPPALYKVVGGGHGGFDKDQSEAVWTRIAAFLHQHLDAP